MKEKIEFLKKHPFLVFSVIFIFIPLIIYLLSVVQWMPSGDNDWAGFWGGYVGAIIGGICTVIGVYWTIEYSQENYKEDVRNRSLPYISLCALQQEKPSDLQQLISMMGYTDTKNDKSDIDLKKYREYRLEKCYIVIENNEIDYIKELTERQEKMVANDGWEGIGTDGSTKAYKKNMVSVPIELENVGNGVALHFIVGLYKAKDNKPKFILPLDLKVGDKMYLHIFSEDYTTCFGEYILEVHYQDILNNKYCQRFEYKLEKGESQNSASSSLSLSGEQIRE